MSVPRGTVCKLAVDSDEIPRIKAILRFERHVLILMRVYVWLGCSCLRWSGLCIPRVSAFSLPVVAFVWDNTIIVHLYANYIMKYWYQDGQRRVGGRSYLGQTSVDCHGRGPTSTQHAITVTALSSRRTLSRLGYYIFCQSAKDHVTLLDADDCSWCWHFQPRSEAFQKKLKEYLTKLWPAVSKQRSTWGAISSRRLTGEDPISDP